MLHPSSPSNGGVPSFRKMVLKGSLDRGFLFFILSYLRPKFAFHGLPNSWKINVGSIALPFFLLLPVPLISFLPNQESAGFRFHSSLACSLAFVYLSFMFKFSATPLILCRPPHPQNIHLKITFHPTQNK